MRMRDFQYETVISETSAGSHREIKVSQSPLTVFTSAAGFRCLNCHRSSMNCFGLVISCGHGQNVIYKRPYVIRILIFMMVMLRFRRQSGEHTGAVNAVNPQITFNQRIIEYQREQEIRLRV
ncbi:hypothetical protein GmarT_09300 [Gimesia maris]|uniref:Uncharacterized protein n=1 Tax=Gimesia maris TaxID=122 RepID=A0ABX5YH71_9PLAN|nr:hypothetical protein GmarT_09300 [Gimesia maris]